MCITTKNAFAKYVFFNRIYISNYIILWNRVFEKLMVTQYFPDFYGIRRGIIVLTRAHHWAQSSAR
jgi:hypothetical protein